MYVLTRYVVWEVLTHFVATLVALTLVVTPVMGVKYGLEQGLPAMVILRIMPYILPGILSITMPAAMLFAVCSVFGRMTGSNEIVALKSLGISPMALIWPVIVLATLLSLSAVVIYEIAVTRCKPSVLRIGAESIEEIVYSKLKQDGSCDYGPVSIIVKDVKESGRPGDIPRYIQPTITLKGPPKMTISAAEAVIKFDLEHHQLYINCFKSDMDVEGVAHMFVPGWDPRTIPIPVPLPDRYHRDEIAMHDVPNLVAELQSTLRSLERLREANQALGVPESPKDADQIAKFQYLIRRLRTEPYRRWANGFACLCFALIGMPVAMLWRHADVLTNFFVCFLPILAVYYPLFVLSDDLSTSGKLPLPPISFWTANVIIATAAILLLRRILRH